MDERAEEAIAQRVQAALAALGVAYEVIPVDPAFADTAQFCATYGYPPETSGNTIIVASKAGPKRYAACVLTADTRLDVNRRVRKLMGVRKASFASAEETRALTGMLIGGVTPFGLPEGVPVYVDAAVMALESVVLGGGSRSCKIEVAASALGRIVGVEVVEGLALREARPRG